MALRVGLALLLGVAVLGLWASGVLADVDHQQVREWLRASGPWGPALFLICFALLEPLGVPGILFVVPASFVWPPWLAFLLSWLGAVSAGIVGFATARWLARDWVAERLPEGLRAWDERLEERGLWPVIVVRLLFFLAPPAHWVLGLSRVRPSVFLLGSAIGFVPGIAVLSFAGPALLELWRSSERPGLWIAGGIVLLALGRRGFQRLRRPRQDVSAGRRSWRLPWARPGL